MIQGLNPHLFYHYCHLGRPKMAIAYNNTNITFWWDQTYDIYKFTSFLLQIFIEQLIYTKFTLIITKWVPEFIGKIGKVIKGSII